MAAPDPDLPRSLLRAVLADPEHLPEHLARFALRHMGPVADRAVARTREQHPGAAPAELRALVVARGRRNTVTEGAFVGGPFLLLIPVAFCAALLNQARTVLELAGLDGRDPTSPERAAELLVLMGVHSDTAGARAALAAPAAPRAGARRTVLRPGALGRLTLRMARLLGLLGPPSADGHQRVRWRQWAVVLIRSVTVGLVFVVGLVAPLVWLPYMAVSYHAATGRLTDRAALFYFSEPAPARTRRGDRSVPGLAHAYAKALGSMVLPALVTFLVLVAGVRIEHSQWPVVTMALVLLSVATGAFWQARRGRRRPRRE